MKFMVEQYLAVVRGFLVGRVDSWMVVRLLGFWLDVRMVVSMNGWIVV